MDSTANPVTWFEIPVRDLQRAKAFYEQVFDASLDLLEGGGVRMAWFPRPENAVGTSGGLIEAPGREPSKLGTVVFFNVRNIDAALATVEKNGGTVVLPKSGGGEHGSIAQFEDPEGNVVALYSDES
jgi:predicted enzyme related to lactoylglutathione lyase